MTARHRYQALDILFERKSQSYFVRVLNSPMGQANGQFVVPFSVDDLTQMAQMPNVGHAQLESWGKALFVALFADEVGQCLRSNQAKLGKETGLRLNLRLDETPELARLPWEYLYDPLHNHFLALSERTPIVRYMALPLEEPILAVESPLHLLVILSNPTDCKPGLAVDREWAIMKSALAPLVEERRLVLTRLEAASWQTLQTHLRRNPAHILHFVGHGMYDSEQKRGALLFENENGKAQLVWAHKLSHLLHNHPDIRLVTLNSCEGAVASEGNPFTGVAQALTQQGVPAVVAMQSDINDKTAIVLSKTFYSAIVDNYSLDAALTQARMAIYGDNDVGWATPVLFMRSRDGRLFDLWQPKTRREDISAQEIVSREPQRLQKLSFPQKKQLVQSLLQCPSVRDQSSLENVLAMLNDVDPLIRSRIMKSSSLVNHVFNIVSSCESFSAIDTLIEIVDFFEGNSDSMQVARRTWEGIKRVNRGAVFIEELIQIVNKLKLRKEVLAECAALALPRRFVRTHQFTDLNRLTREIWDFNPQPNGTVPVLLFVLNLRQHIQDGNPEAAQQLGIWVENVAALRGVPSEASKGSLSEMLASFDKSVPSLQIELEPHDDNINDGHKPQYRPRFYLWSELRREWIRADGSFHSLNEIGVIIRQVLEHVGRERIDTESITIEFFLPTDLLSTPVEQLGRDSIGVTLGDEYSVVVRPLDRARDPGHRGHFRWKTSWSKFKSATQRQALESSMLQILNAEHFAEESRYLFEAFRNLICLGIDRTDSRILRLAVNAGLPIVLWSRHENTKVNGTLRHLICEQHLPNLPRHVFDTRVQKDTSGLTVSLLWDDYEKLPQDWIVAKSYALHSPSKELSGD